MRSIKEGDPDKILTEKFSFNFDLEADALCLIEVIASAKSWWQNFKSLRSFLKDDDIALMVDRLEITTSRSRDADVRPAWNGNELKGLLKTVVVAIKLKKGKHALHFTPDRSPYLKSIIIFQQEDAENIIYSPSGNNPAQAGHGRPWLSFVLINLKVNDLTILAAADKKKRDDDDLKLIIDGEIQKNQAGSSHKDWFWCGKINKGEEKSFCKPVSWNGGTHYLDLYADESPDLKKIELALVNNIDKRIPAVDDPEWTGDFNDDSDRMILARAIFGEARSLPELGRVAVGWVARNRIGGRDWGDDYHEVILHPKHFSAFNPGDPNLPYVKNPFLDKTQIAVWYECYKIASQVISGEAPDPTDGANHYFSTSVKPPYWVKDKSAHLKLKVGNTLFYEIKSDNSEGFVKIKTLLIILTSVIALFFGGMYLAIVINNKFSCEQEGNFFSYDINEYRNYFINPVTEEVGVEHFDNQGKFLISQELTYDGYAKSQVIGFPYTEMFGYFTSLHKKDEITNFTDPEARDEYYRNYIALMIQGREYGDPEEVYRGDILTSSWKWKDRSHVIVYRDCGLNCLIPYEIDISTGRTSIGQPSVKNEKTIDILEVPLDKIAAGEYEEAYFTANSVKQRVVYKEKGIDHLLISPDKRLAGFLYESGGYYEPCHKISLGIINIQDQEIKNIFESDCKLAKWEWINKNRAAVYKNCGSECQTLYLVDALTGEEMFIQSGVNYSWSPDKRLVLGYHYIGKYGITVADSSGGELLKIDRERFSNDDSDMIEATEAVWSPDSTKLALAIKKVKQDIMELMVYDAKNGFKRIYNGDAGDFYGQKVRWDVDSRGLHYGALAAALNN